MKNSVIIKDQIKKKKNHFWIKDPDLKKEMQNIEVIKIKFSALNEKSCKFNLNEK